MDVGINFEAKEDMGEGCSPRDEFNGEYLQIDDNFYDTPTCFESTHFPRLESTLMSCHET